LQIERDDKGLSRRACESQVRCIGHAPFAIAIHADSGDGVKQRLLQTVSQSADAPHVLRHVLACKLSRLAETGDPGNVLRARPEVAFVMPAT
jgi:hypothetical protein